MTSHQATLTHKGGWYRREEEFLTANGNAALRVLHLAHQAFHLQHQQENKTSAESLIGPRTTNQFNNASSYTSITIALIKKIIYSKEKYKGNC
jgi:hypothetical protein